MVYDEPPPPPPLPPRFKALRRLCFWQTISNYHYSTFHLSVYERTLLLLLFLNYFIGLNSPTSHPILRKLSKTKTSRAF